MRLGRRTVVGIALALAGVIAFVARPARSIEIAVDVPDGVDVSSVRLDDAAPTRVVGARAIFVTKPGTRRVVRATGACTQTVDGSSSAVLLAPIVSLGLPLAQVGFDAPFAITAREGCAEAHAGVLTWKQIGGVPLAQLEADGLVVRGRTRPWQARPTTWGIVPVSPDTRDTVTLEATWTHGAAWRTTIDVSAAARATGVPTIVAGQALFLAGSAFHLVKATPPSAKATFTPVAEGLTRFLPETSAHYLLADGAGRTLSVRTGRHDTTALDCGRSECHRAVAEAAQSSAMTHVLHRGFDGALGNDYRPACAIACHAVGEPGLDDGGFLSALRESGLTGLGTPHAGAWDALPRALRRAGGVGCTACHGPATIPEPSSRWTVLRADVCATCHDAPPRYPLVQSWRASRMASADHDPRARATTCARCHTTHGFLRTLGDTTAREPPPTEEVGIACAACHAPHTAGSGLHLVRTVPAGSPLEASLDATTRLCAACHGGREPAVGFPAASAAIVWAGRDPALPTAIPGPHATLGCVSCHMGKTPERGAEHRMTTTTAQCTPCHAELPREPSPTVAERAARVWRALGGPALAGPLHAHGSDREPRAALRAAAIVLEDPAAYVHNAPFARALLDVAEAADPPGNRARGASDPAP